MSDRNSTGKIRPNKPRPDFPLFPHASGRWAKKIRGKLHYFGRWEDGADAALVRYLDKKDTLHAGLTPADTQGELTVRNVCGRFLTFKLARFEAGKLSHGLHEEYKAVAKRTMVKLGKSRIVKSLGPDDFARVRNGMPKTWGVLRVANEIVRVKSIFKYVFEEGLIPRVPVYGQMFRPPSRKEMRVHRASVGSRLLSADDVRRILDEAGLALRAMILLGINGAFGNSDLARLPLSAIDLKSGWLDYARVKTGIERKVPLWPETVAAIREWLAVRPKPAAGNESLVFLTVHGGAWAHKGDGPLTKEFRKLLDKLGITGAKGFYSLRRTFQNVAEESKDFLASRAIMGHATADVSDFYRESVSRERLKAVTEHVRAWLFPDHR